MKNFDERMPFELAENEDVSRVINEIQDDSITNLRILALSGMGKTRWVYESFRSQSDWEGIYYCNDVENASFLAKFDLILDDDELKKRTIVLDDCPSSVLEKVNRKIYASKQKIRVVSLSNDIMNRGGTDVTLEFFSISSLEVIAQSIIEKNVEGIAPASLRQLISYTEGIPKMAVLIV